MKPNIELKILIKTDTSCKALETNSPDGRQGCWYVPAISHGLTANKMRLFLTKLTFFAAYPAVVVTALAKLLTDKITGLVITNPMGTLTKKGAALTV